MGIQDWYAMLGLSKNAVNELVNNEFTAVLTHTKNSHDDLHTKLSN